MKQNLTRRHFLNLVAAAGGSTAVYQTSMALGLMKMTDPMAKLDLKNVEQNGKTVAILGAGIAGLTVAYELERAGYNIVMLEAAHRVGGRNMTVRHGDTIDEMGNTQICNFDDDEDLYFNCGPARLPGHHRRVMHYCKVLGLPLQVKANTNRLAYSQYENDFDGKPRRIGRFISDARGFLSELVYKSSDQGAFDAELSAEDNERLRLFARRYGDLNEQGKYKGTIRGGYKSGGFIKPAEIYDSMSFKELLDSNFWLFPMHATENPDWNEPLLEVTGGMDGIVRGFLDRISSPIYTHAQVQSIMLNDDKVDVVYTLNGQRHKLSVDYCFNSIPTHLMVGVENNFPKDYREGLASLTSSNFFKIGLQMKERFWEDEGIYGGTTYTDQIINEIWYPSHGFNRQKGIMLGAYCYADEQALPFQRMSSEERIRVAGECGNKIHKNYSSYIENGVSIPWGRMNHMMGCGTRWNDELREKYFKLLQEPAGGRHYMIGDQISYHSSWQEGAFGSAEVAIGDLDQRVRAEMSVTGEG